MYISIVLARVCNPYCVPIISSILPALHANWISEDAEEDAGRFLVTRRELSSLSKVDWKTSVFEKTGFLAGWIGQVMRWERDTAKSVACKDTKYVSIYSYEKDGVGSQ
jgi:hypothetical protein